MPRIHVSYDTDDPDEWTLEQAIERKTALGQTTVVPKDFKTDLASVPSVVWRKFPRWGRWSAAAIVHDFLYRTRPRPSGLTRYRADRIFLDLMRADGVRYGDAMIIYRAVREFGGRAWNA